MSITLQELQPKKIGEVVRDIEHKDKVNLTMQINDNKAFANALAKVQAPPDGMTKNLLSKANNDNDNISMGEAMLYIIGEYLITAWDVLIKGEPAKINGDNFINLCASIGTDDENIEFVNVISDNFTEITTGFKEQGAATKKSHRGLPLAERVEQNNTQTVGDI